MPTFLIRWSNSHIAHTSLTDPSGGGSCFRMSPFCATANETIQNYTGYEILFDQKVEGQHSRECEVPRTRCDGCRVCSVCSFHSAV